MALTFERAYEGTCSCDEVLDWEWDSDQMVFIASCSTCVKLHRLTPLTAEVEEDEPEDSEEDPEE